MDPRSVVDDTVLGSFASLGGGLNGSVFALALRGDDTVYAGGSFTNAGGNAAADRIAAWSNADDTWHALGTGVSDNWVNAVAASGDDTVYAGGPFISAGGRSDDTYIAAWSTRSNTWFALGSGQDATVRALSLSGDDTVYAGGDFTNAGGNSAADRIAAWSNADDTWHALGAGVNNRVYALTSSGDDTVYAGGYFTSASGVPGTNRIAAWSNADDTWHALGNGLAGDVYSVALAADDTVYAAGSFTDAGGNPAADGIAAWSNADDTWQALGTGMNGNYLYAVAADATRGLVYAGGDFASAGGVTSSRVAVWDVGLGVWIALRAAAGQGAAGDVTALALDDSVVYLGGTFVMAGGTMVNRIARWTWDAPSAQAVPAAGAHGTTIQVRGSGLIGIRGANAVRVNGAPVPYTRDDSTTVSLTVPGSLNDGTYPIAIDAVGGTATTTFTVTGSPAPVPPRTAGAPTGVTAVAGEASASVSWTAPADSGSYPISTYQVTSTPGGKSCLVSAPVLACEVSGLTNGTSYTFTVRALNGAGWGSDSTPSNSVTPQAPVVQSIVITGSRDTSYALYVRVRGTTTGLAGQQVTPWVRFPGEASYSAGAGLKTVDVSGRFEWSRRTGKKLSVYFTHGSVKSNTVAIPAR